MKIVGAYIGVGFATIIFTIVYLFLFCPDVFFNGYIKGKIEKSFMKSNPGNTIRINSFHYKFWSNKIETDTISIYKNDTVLLYNIIGCDVDGIKFKHLINGGPKDNDLSGYVID